MQLPGSGPGWIPLSGQQFIDAGSSTALTIPSPPTATSLAGCDYVVILQAQGANQWIREDGQAVTGAASGGLLMQVGDWKFVYGLAAIKNIRIIHDSAGGSLVAIYYLYRRG